jgi:type II secretory pathway pseudopilin PulG
LKRTDIQRRATGFTLVEISVALLLFMVVGLIVYSVLMSSTTLLAKNLSLNQSNTSVRGTLDRIFSEINQANGLPTLINADGTAADGVGPAAGIIFDRYVGGPFVVGNPGTGLPATATAFNLYYSTDSSANPPLPVRNDVVLMDGVTRALVSSCSAPSGYSSPVPSPTPVVGKMVTVTLQGSLGSYKTPPIASGTAISWVTPIQQAAYVVHRKAFVVVPPASVLSVNGIYPPAELRMYPDAEAVTDYNDATKYIVLTRAIGTGPRGNSPFESGVDLKTENKPFWIYASNGANYLSIAMRVEDQQFNKRLMTQQANQTNTFLRVDSVMRPRNFL